MHVPDKHQMVFEFASLVDVIVGAISNTNPTVLDTSKSNKEVLAGVAANALTAKLEEKSNVK